MKNIVYAVIPARSGSKGLPNKNIKKLNGIPLLAYSIAVGKKLGCEKVICSTDSIEYAQIAESFGAEVPFLRSPKAASDNAMEEDILRDLRTKFIENNIALPDYIVWLRPTFVFRDINSLKRCIKELEEDQSFSAARTVCETESRLYKLKDGLLIPSFDDQNKSMIRRQDIGRGYKVFSTDVIRFKGNDLTEDFLGRKVYAEEINKICGLDIDDEEDFLLAETLVKHNPALTKKYIYL